MHADLSQLLDMVADLDVTVAPRGPLSDDTVAIRDGIRAMRRMHMRHGKPFCMVGIELMEEIYDRAPERFETENVIVVLKDIGIDIATARQLARISYADVEAARTLDIHLNSPVMRVSRHALEQIVGSGYR